MMALDGLQPLMTKGSPAPANPRADLLSKSAPRTAAGKPAGSKAVRGEGSGEVEGASFEKTLQAETKGKRSPNSDNRDSLDSESSIRKSLREERSLKKNEQPKRPASVQNEIASPDAVPTLKDGFQGPKSEYLRPDFFEAPVDGTKMRDKVTVERFLTAMKSEAGVPTDQLIRAMKSLPAESMTDSPQQNMSQIIMALGLVPEKQIVAEKLFQGMASNLGEGSLASDIQKYSPKFLEREAWLDNVDQISQRFFMRNQEQLGLTSPMSQSQSERPGLPENVSKFDEESKAPFGVALTPFGNLTTSGTQMAGAIAMAAPSVPGGPGVSALDEKRSTNLDTLLNEMAGQVESIELASSQAPKSGVIPQQSPLMATSTLPVELAAPNFTKTVPVSPSAVAIGSSLKGALWKNSEKSKTDEGLDSLSEGTPAMASQDLRSFDQELGAEDIAGLKAPLTKEPVQNLGDLNQSAASIIKEGGGEIVMKLKPEGLGEVKLKVMVENGRVNVEMIADNPETKRMLESQSLDLKKSLEAQMIQVDGMRIDVRDSSQTQNERHPQQNNFDREMARDFLGQFRDQNQAFRQSMFELPNVKAYRGSGKQAEEIRPTPAARNRPETSKRLNLVA